MENIYIILVEPIYKGNVGAVARIMRNFAYPHLRIVGAIPEKEDFVTAVHSEEILQTAVIFDTLQSAIQDLDRVIALSRRKGKKKLQDLNPRQLGCYVAESTDLKIGVVFGRETFGLTDEEAQICHLRCHICANPDFPSLNLAQAVAIVLYEVYTTAHENYKKHHHPDKADKSLVNSTIDYVMEVLQSIDAVSAEHDKESIASAFHSLMSRANITRQLSSDIKKIFNRIHLSFLGRGKGFKHDKKL
jgi:tRNA (cytidine32/uridine32-2'-O)-methyltransferase